MYGKLKSPKTKTNVNLIKLNQQSNWAIYSLRNLIDKLKINHAAGADLYHLQSCDLHPTTLKGGENLNNPSRSATAA